MLSYCSLHWLTLYIKAGIDISHLSVPIRSPWQVLYIQLFLINFSFPPIVILNCLLLAFFKRVINLTSFLFKSKFIYFPIYDSAHLSSHYYYYYNYYFILLIIIIFFLHVLFCYYFSYSSFRNEKISLIYCFLYHLYPFFNLFFFSFSSLFCFYCYYYYLFIYSPFFFYD